MNAKDIFYRDKILDKNLFFLDIIKKISFSKILPILITTWNLKKSF